MAIKYTFQHVSVANETFKCDISNEDYVGDATEIAGSCTLDFAEVEHPFVAIRGCGLIMELDASLDQTFEDIAIENERTYKVEWYKYNGVDWDILFLGFISPEGIFEDWVNDKWVVTINAIGGLGYLENLSYVDEDGLPFIGLQTPMQIISNCLKRTGLELNINTRIDFEYVGFDNTDTVTFDRNILQNISSSTDRYRRDDEDTPMDCKEVLESVLNIFNASICQMNGEWWIFKSNDLLQGILGLTTRRFLRHDFEGETITLDPFATPSVRINIGSHINNATLFHCNENQRKERKSSLASFKVNYQYGLVSSIFVNETVTPEFGWIGGVTTEVEGWTVFNSGGPDFLIIPNPADDFLPGSTRLYLRLSSYDAQVGSGESPVLLLRSDEIDVVGETLLTIDIGMLHDKYVNATVVKIFFKDTADDLFYFDVQTGWQPYTSDGFIYLGGTVDEGGFYGRLFNDFELNLPAFPDDGVVYVEFWQPRAYWSPTRYVWINRVKIYPSVDNSIKGENHTVERTGSKSNRVDEVLEVFNGDSVSNIYYGTLYKEDAETPTSLWKRQTVTEEKPLLQLVGEERLRHFQGVQILFSGDVYGQVPYLSMASISGIEGRFNILKNVYNAQANTTSLVLLQGYTDELEDIFYEFAFDFGNTVKPTIRG